MSIIYCHTNTINGKKYVGQTKHTIEHRWYQHCQPDDNNNHFHNAIVKYSPDCWTHEIIAEYDDEILNEAEIYWIAYFNSFHNGYNETTGGDGGYIRSESTVNKMIASKKGKLVGEDNPMWGRTHSEDSIKLMADKKRGKVVSEATKHKHSDDALGTHRSEETKRLMSEKQMGRACSEETRLKMSLKRKGVQWSEEKRRKIMEGRRLARINKLNIATEANTHGV